MTDRDHFAAAALTGLLDKSDAEDIAAWWPEIACAAAYRWADAMLRERERVTEPMPSDATGSGSVTQEPVAWAIESSAGGSLMGFCHTKRDATRFAHAIIEDTKSAHFTLRHVPLYRQPQPTLTDAEREAVVQAMGLADWHKAYFSHLKHGEPLPSATLRGLLERLK